MREVDNAPVSIGDANHEKREKTEKVHFSVPKSRGVPKVVCLRGCVPKEQNAHPPRRAILPQAHRELPKPQSKTYIRKIKAISEFPMVCALKNSKKARPLQGHTSPQVLG